MSCCRAIFVFLALFSPFVSMIFSICGLVTKNWVQAKAKRTSNPLESDGTIHFGLFEGRKELNVAYGWRNYEINVINLLKYEPDFLIYGFWIGTVISVVAAVIFSALSSVSTVVKLISKMSKYKRSWKFKVYLWSFLSLFSQLCAIIFWVAEFHFKIQYNVLSQEDRDNMWTSNGMAEMGYSFWFVVAAAGVTFIEIFITCLGSDSEEIEKETFPIENKANSAIMLY